MKGCYASVMGMPLCHLIRALRKLDVNPAQTYRRHANPCWTITALFREPSCTANKLDKDKKVNE